MSTLPTYTYVAWTGTSLPFTLPLFGKVGQQEQALAYKVDSNVRDCLIGSN
jgi:hypothetical protein